MFTNLSMQKTVIGQFKLENPDTGKTYETHFSVNLDEGIDASVHRAALQLYDAAKPGTDPKTKAEDPVLEDIRKQLRAEIEKL